MNQNQYTILIHPITKEKREVKNGMAWTVVFLGVLALLFRRQFKLAGIFLLILAFITIFEIFILDMIFGVHIPAGAHTGIAAGLGVGFGSVANESRIKQLLKKGYEIYNPNNKIKAYVISAFCKDNSGGNKAGIVLFNEELSEIHKKAIASRLGYSETVFVTKSESADFKFEYFTPSEEVPLCGHATIAAFALLQSQGKLDKTEYTFETKARVLVANIENDKIFMEQTKPQYLNVLSKDEIVKCFDIDCISEKYPIQMMSTGLPDIMIPIKDEETLNVTKPNFEAISDISRKYDCVGIHAFAIEGDRIICRNFAPLYDILEESATGTANCALVSYLYKHGIMRKDTYTIEQGYSLNSPSEITVKIEIDADADEISRIFVGGSGVFVEELELEV